MIEKAGIHPARITAISPVVEIPDQGVDPGTGRYVVSPVASALKRH